MGAADPPIVHFGGEGSRMPIIHISSSGDPYTTDVAVEVWLSNHDRPVEYLRQFAARLLLAAQELEDKAGQVSHLGNRLDALLAEHAPGATR